MKRRNTVPTPEQPPVPNAFIEATPNGFVVWDCGAAWDRGMPRSILGSFESRRSLLAWLAERLVQR